MKVPTTEPLTFVIRGRSVTSPAVVNEYNKNTDWWEGKGFDVRRRLDGGKLGDLVYAHWKIIMSGPWYSDSDPEGLGDTLEEAVENLEEWIEETIKTLQEVGL